MTTIWTDFRPILAASAEFRALIADRAWAEQAYLMFPNREWRSGDKRFNMSWRAAGSFVAATRGAGEDYLDYYIPYCWGDLVDDPAMQARLAELFAALGWKEIGLDDRAELFLDALRLLALSEERPGGEVPDWYRGVFDRDPDPDAPPVGLMGRVHRLARDGRVSQREFDSMISAMVDAFTADHGEWNTIVAYVEAARVEGEALPAVNTDAARAV
ncbi:hypothetical protein [Rhizobium leguminosarum]|jgi:hypothetical protein|uniref:hypothetical protein n=1 Tax=Rhizobium leguminosarum TaxID=384 RepID=UPI002E0DF552|nr:hypothetical protein U8Q02_39055 [Rhizobium leguminosarum]